MNLVSKSALNLIAEELDFKREIWFSTTWEGPAFRILSTTSLLVFHSKKRA